MSTKQPENAPASSPIYQIYVQEMLDSTWTDWFDGLSITTVPGGKTLLYGPVIDQAALNGLLNKIHHLNLTLLSVHRVETESSAVDPTPPVREKTHQEPQ